MLGWQADMAKSSSAQQAVGRRNLKEWVRWAAGSWATRSLGVGALGSLLDLAVLLFASLELGLSSRLSAGLGVSAGAVFNFVANRQFAFRDHDSRLGPQMVKYLLGNAAAMLVHANLVGVLTDSLRFPLLVAKYAADLLIFPAFQLLLLRFVVFPKRKELGATVPLTPP